MTNNNNTAGITILEGTKNSGVINDLFERIPNLTSKFNNSPTQINSPLENETSLISFFNR